MSKREKIVSYIEREHNRVGFSSPSNYFPNLGFKLTNIDSKNTESFSVASVNEAEELVVSFIPTATKGNIFINDIYSEDENLFLRVQIILPKPF